MESKHAFGLDWPSDEARSYKLLLAVVGTGGIGHFLLYLFFLALGSNLLVLQTSWFEMNGRAGETKPEELAIGRMKAEDNSGPKLARWLPFRVT